MSYQEDYDRHKADGSLLDPMPENYVSVRRLAVEIGGRSWVRRVLGSGADGKSQGLFNAGVRDKAKYNKNFEMYLPPEEAEILREYIMVACGLKKPEPSREEKILDGIRNFTGKRTKAGKPYVRELRKVCKIKDITVKERDINWSLIQDSRLA